MSGHGHGHYSAEWRGLDGYASDDRAGWTPYRTSLVALLLYRNATHLSLYPPIYSSCSMRYACTLKRIQNYSVPAYIHIKTSL